MQVSTISARGPELSHTGIPSDGLGAESSFALSAPARALTSITSPQMDEPEAGADSSLPLLLDRGEGRGEVSTSDQFAICNLQSSISNSPHRREAVSLPEAASGRQSSQEAASSNLPDARDGAAPCPEEKVELKQKTAGLALRQAPLPSAGSNLKRHQLLEGQRRLAFVLRTRELRAAGYTWDAIARRLEIPAPSLIRWCAQVEGIDSPCAQQCAPQNHKSGRPRKFPLTAEQVSAIKSISLAINRTYADTSTPEAIRRALAAGALPPDLAADIREREAAGLPLLTRATRDQVSLTEMQVRAFRSPNEANLDYIQSPGSLMLTRDELTGAERFFQPGEAYTIDDGSINFGCCVPLERPGDKCWEKFGVIVGRFQFIPVVDHRTRAILGFSYTARPRDSYRAEDLTATMQTVFAEHGLPRVMFLEFGTSDSNLVNDTLRRVGVEPRHVRSPHEKVVEKAFDLLWTKLSSMPGQIGRFRGEMEEENCLLTACKQGHKDPRKYFPSLPVVIASLRQAIAEQNAQWMNSPQYGRWQPGEWFARDAHKITRKLPPQDAWMFSPVITRPLLVRGFCVQTSVPLMPGFSLKFHFSAEFFAEYHGSEVILHFNPFAPECEAMVVCARTGKVLGPAQQINRLARFTRRTFGYGADPDIGHIAARKNAQALHRTVVALKVGANRQSSPRSGEVAQATAEHRDGLGNLIRAEVGTPSRPSRASINSDSDSETQRSALSPEQTQPSEKSMSRFAQIANQLREDFQQ